MPFRLPLYYREPTLRSREPSRDEMDDYIAWMVREIRLAKKFRDSIPKNNLPKEPRRPQKTTHDAVESADGQG